MMPPTGKSSDIIPRGPIIVIVILFIAIIAAGLYFYQSQEHQIKDSVTTDLSTIATLKANQIAAWRGERLFDARGISSESFFIDGVDHYLKYGDNESREKILGRFRELTLSHYYQNVLLVDPQGNVRLSLDPAITSMQPSVKTQVNESLRNGDFVLTDFYQMPGSNVIRLDTISPLRIKANGSEKPVGAIVLSIDPDDFLYPLIRSWPVPSGSAETLLVERKGDHVLFLNDLRYRNNTALNLTIPLSQPNVPAVMAVLGTTGAFEGKDYRGIDVISILEPVPGSPWFMVAKVDTDEAFSGWRSSSALIIALVAGSIAGALIVVGLLWQRRQKNYYQSLYIAEAEQVRAENALRASEIRYRRLFEAAQDGILILDAETGQIVDVNPFLIDMLGFSREQFLAKKLWEIGHFKDIVANKDNFSELQRREYIRYEDLPMESADGRHIDVEFVSNVYMVGDKRVIQCNIRDITERKHAEEERARLAAIVEQSDEVIIGKTLEGIITSWNIGAERIYGYSAQEMVGKSVSLLVPPDHLDDTQIILERVKNGEPVIRYETLRRKKDGGLINVTLTASPVRDTQNHLIGISVIGHDITERKRIEKALQQVNKQLNLLSSITRHDILNQLMALKGYLYLSHAVIDNPTTLIEYIKKEELAANTIEAQITFTKNYQKLGVAAPEWQNVNTSIHKAIAGLPMRDVHVEVDPKNPEVFADRLFEKVFYNLIDNALRYGGDQMKTIRFSSHRSDTSLTIICEDDGVGITAEDKKRLFTKGFGKNSGLGLFLSREILAITGITITENGTPGKGARFEITVPKGMYRFTGTEGK
jgi:PAS domain S-box-containing protein